MIFTEWAKDSLEDGMSDRVISTYHELGDRVLDNFPSEIISVGMATWKELKWAEECGWIDKETSKRAWRRFEETSETYMKIWEEKKRLEVYGK